MKQIVCLFLLFLTLSSMAFAGTAFFDFDHDIGLFDDNGLLISSEGRARFTGFTHNAILSEGEALRITGTVSTSMTLRPSQDAGEVLVGLYVSGPAWEVAGGCYGDGRLILSGGPHPGATLNATFDNPDALTTLTMTYSRETDTATLSVNGVLKLTFTGALGAPSAAEYVGVFSTGPSGFDTFTATGPEVPDYPPPDSDSDGVPDKDDAFPSNPNGQTDTDGDGIGDEWEMVWFSDLTTAGALTDYDDDGTSDREEFDAYQFNCDPTDGATQLFVTELVGLGLLCAGILAAASRRVLEQV